MKEILEALPDYQNQITQCGEILLSNLVMVGEQPAPTFREERRRDFLLSRFAEFQLQNCSYDEAGNALAILPGKKGDRNIMIAAHMDSIYDESADHNISIQPNYAKGISIGDNTLGVAALVTLPVILEKLGIQLDSDLILMGSSRSLGKGDIAGIRFFLKNTVLPINHGLVLEGVRLGRLSYNSIGMLRCEISCTVPEEYDWTRFGTIGAIITLNEVIDKILEIPLPRRPRTSIVLGAVDGGKSFDTIATSATLKFEIRSESRDLVKDLRRQISNICAAVGSHTGADVELKIYAERRPGGIEFDHPMSENARRIMEELDIKPRISPSTSELSAFIAKSIPALTIGLTTGENMGKPNETIEIKPLYKGLTQLIGLLLAIDKGYCDEY